MFDKILDEPLISKRHVTADLESRICLELRRGERLLWAGQPRPYLFARKFWGTAILGLVWTACTAPFLFFTDTVMQSARVQSGEGIVGALIPLMLVAIGLLIIRSPFWMRRTAKRTCYALTDRRATLWEAGWFKSVEVRSYGPESLTGMYRVEYAGGGDLVLAKERVTRPNCDGVQSVSTRHGFMGIENVREVEELLRRALLATDG